MYSDAKEMSSVHNSTPLDIIQTSHSTPDLNSETTAGYPEDTNPQRDLMQLQEHFKQLKERLNQLGPTTNLPTHVEELAHLTEKLQQLAMMLQPHSPCRPVEEPIHTTMQQYTNTLCAIQLQMNLTMSLLYDIPTFDG